MRNLQALAACLLFGVSSVSGQQPPAQQASAQPSVTDDTGGKRIFWIIPNFRTSPTLDPYKPVSAREKFKIATQDTFDQGTIALAAAFAGQSQLSNSNPSFGQGAKGYAHYFATSYADFAIGDYMTEAIFPVMLHQDPRYFRRGKGSGLSRLGYACSQIFVTHNDSGRIVPNYSELVGNSVAVAISQGYYPENRNAGDAVGKLASQVGVDMVSNVLKEFWPDISRKFSHKRSGGD